MTYSIVARDASTGELGVAVQSHYFGVGSVVPWAEAGVGAVATQAFIEPSYGPLGLELLRAGQSSADVLKALLSKDPGAATRQVGIVDSIGRASAHTGALCVQEAGHRTSDGVAVQANMMERPTVWDAMVTAYEATGGDLGYRLLAALDAAEAEGGDIRGRQSAALLIVGGEPTDRSWDSVRINVRVDDHSEPLIELRRLFEYSKFYNNLLNLLKKEGLMRGEFRATPADVEAALSELRAGQELLAPNQEATVWCGVLLARAGRIDEARAQISRALQSYPRLETFIRRLPAAGVLPNMQLVDRLLA